MDYARNDEAGICVYRADLLPDEGSIWVDTESEEVKEWIEGTIADSKVIQADTVYEDYNKFRDYNKDGKIDQLDKIIYDSLEWLSDLNGDGKVDKHDLEMHNTFEHLEDLNHDGKIDVKDLLIHEDKIDIENFDSYNQTHLHDPVTDTLVQID